MKYILILHFIGTLLVWLVMLKSVWRKKAQDEDRLWLYVINGLVIGLMWEPFYIMAIWKDIR